MGHQFNWEDEKVNQVKRAIRQQKRFANLQFPDHKLRFPDECRDAGGANPNYTKLITRVTKECKLYQLQAMERRNKLGRRDT